LPLRLLAFLQTDCPTCRLIAPYLNRLAEQGAAVTGVSQDDEAVTSQFATQLKIRFPITRDADFQLSRQYDLVTVPTLLLLDEHDAVLRSEPGFDKGVLNEIAALFN